MVHLQAKIVNSNYYIVYDYLDDKITSRASYEFDSLELVQQAIEDIESKVMSWLNSRVYPIYRKGDYEYTWDGQQVDAIS